jgi:hypothetical protein
VNGYIKDKVWGKEGRIGFTGQVVWILWKLDACDSVWVFCIGMGYGCRRWAALSSRKSSNLIIAQLMSTTLWKIPRLTTRRKAECLSLKRNWSVV